MIEDVKGEQVAAIHRIAEKGYLLGNSGLSAHQLPGDYLHSPS